jgi:hypothetical protein
MPVAPMRLRSLLLALPCNALLWYAILAAIGVL